ncbi:DUF5709 domain-containing protein [Streptomyces sp. RerS4]|uniref:DUF5709 domain-containing protein n=1 Tax=Streptomyces sp. RerS4 TaxID=2942449 RepID=UPI00201C9079|nr:DUF5709 domain-containing protein [Streptomyces sp. RerS4]UQW99614.1 DUF5709 domain-containing protein [Streptomyces sp. RerS4]
MSSIESHGDEVYQPHEGDDDPARAMPDMENALDEPGLDETLDTGYSPPERPLAVNDPATTAEGRHSGENLDQRLARELPEAEADAEDVTWGDIAAEGEDASAAGHVRAGRLAARDESRPPHHVSVVAEDVGVNGGAASAEEAAMHIIQEPDEQSDERSDEQG